MRVWIFIGIVGMILTSCHSQKKMAARRAAYVSTQPVEVAVEESMEDTLLVEQTPQPRTERSETVVKTHGADLLEYCVIVGSFRNEQNAINLRNALIRQGFLGSSVMRNEEGMYRVSAECLDKHEEAWQEVSRVRSNYPQYRDAWLLGIK